MPEYEVGDTVHYSVPGGTRVVTVTYKDNDIKNGYPGFDGVNADGTWWGYDDQIEKVVRTK